MISFVLDIPREIGATVLFGLETTCLFFRRGTSFWGVVDQMYNVGVRSLPMTLFTGAFVGGIMAIQINLQLRDFGAQAFLGGLSTSVTIRDVGPVLIAFILAGKVGAYTSAELATMRVTDQIDAIRCLGADPVEFLVLPRMVAVVLSSFLLLIVGLAFTIVGGVLVSQFALDIDPVHFLTNIPRVVTWWSVGSGVVKSFVIGLLIAVICCYRGYTAKVGAKGVGDTVKGTAVLILVTIIVADYLMSLCSSGLYEFLRMDIL